MEPPADTEEQIDGSRIATLPNGDTLRYTQRADGEHMIVMFAFSSARA